MQGWGGGGQNQIFPSEGRGGAEGGYPYQRLLGAGDGQYSLRVLHYLSKIPKKCLETAGKDKNRKYPKACLKQRLHFTPFIASVYGLLGVEAEATLKRISIRLAKKWTEPYSRICGYVKSRVEINLARETHRCIRGSRVPASQISVK